MQPGDLGQIGTIPSKGKISAYRHVIQSDSDRHPRTYRLATGDRIYLDSSYNGRLCLYIGEVILSTGKFYRVLLDSQELIIHWSYVWHQGTMPQIK